jgi:phosphomannomutase
MSPKFGTSGLRGLVTELTEPLVRDYTRAFLSACDIGTELFIGRDLRPSSPQLAQWISDEAVALGVSVRDCGALPTPALALAAKGHGAIMVTGSHIPADRNGLKFYVPNGEITKQDEVAILAALGRPKATQPQGSLHRFDASSAFVERYENAFGPSALSGLRIGVYEHSSVARDLLMDVMTRLGARPVSIARSDIFIPVDTEALDPAAQALFAGWIKTHDLDVLISTDGDADRPMLVDDTATVIPGDVLGALTARAIGAEIICTPISSNTQVDALFPEVKRTRIGSPHVIEAMEAALSDNSAAKVAGYEANGGFLLGFNASGPTGGLAPLMTRDCLLPLIAPLAAAKAKGQPISAMVADLPPRFTAADRLQGIAPDISAPFLQEQTQNDDARAAFFEGSSADTLMNLTDGLRFTFANGDIVHLRPSGNAPEFRCYVEASSQTQAQTLLAFYLNKLKNALN